MSFANKNTNGSLWYGKRIHFPGFLYKKNTATGGRRSNMSLICYKPAELWNTYTPGSGVGSTSIATRRAKLRQATSCYDRQSVKAKVQLL